MNQVRVSSPAIKPPHPLEHVVASRLQGNVKVTAEAWFGGQLDELRGKVVRIHRAQPEPGGGDGFQHSGNERDRKSTRLNSSHTVISYAVFCLKKKKKKKEKTEA